MKSTHSIIDKTGYPDLHDGYSTIMTIFFNSKIISEFKNSLLTYTSDTN